MFHIAEGTSERSADAGGMTDDEEKTCRIKTHAKFATNHYMLKVNNRNTRTSCQICSKLTIKMA